MKITYLGPSQSVIVAPYGRHMQGEVKEYPDDFGEELLATSHKQQFEEMGSDSQPDDMTVPALKAELRGKTAFADDAKKAELVNLVKAQRAQGGE